MNGSVKGLGLLMVALGFAGCAHGGGAGSQKMEKVSPQQSFMGLWQGIPGVDPQSPKDTTGKTPPTHALMINADSTYAEVTMRQGQAACGGGRWALSGMDSVSWIQGGSAPTVKDKIVFKDKQFFLYRKGDLAKAAEAYQRVDTTVTPKPKSIAALPQCATAVRRQSAPRKPAAGSTPATPATPVTPPKTP